MTTATTTVPLTDLPGRPCPIAASLELTGGPVRALLVVRELWMGSSRFTDIVRGTGAPRDRVAARLRALEAAGVIERREDPGLPAPLGTLHGRRPGAAAGAAGPAGLGEQVRRRPRRSRSRAAPRRPPRSPDDRPPRPAPGASPAPAPSPGTTRPPRPRRDSPCPAWTTCARWWTACCRRPPIAGLMQMALVEAEPGRVVFTCVPDESAYNPIRAVHGGLVAPCSTRWPAARCTARCRRGAATPRIETKVR